MSEIRDTVWRAGKLLADDVDTEEAWTDLGDLLSDDDALWEAHAVSYGGSGAMRSIAKDSLGRWQQRLRSQGADAIRMGDTLYRINKNGKWTANVAGMAEYLMTHHPDVAAEILAAAFPAYSVRVSRLTDTATSLVGESTAAALKDTFCRWTMSSDEGVLRASRIGERGTPKWAETMTHGELRKEDK